MFYNLIDGETVISSEPIEGAEKSDLLEENDMVYIQGILQKRVDPLKKHKEVFDSIITTESLDDIDLEGEIFSDFEIGEMITARVFGGNPHAEKALTNKVLAVTIALLQGVEMTEGMAGKVAEATAKKAEVDAVRNLFNLGNL